MKRKLVWYLGGTGVMLGLAGVVLVLYPLSDPLFGKNRVFIDWGFSVLPEDWRARLSGELAVEVAGRAITWVLNPSAAEVILVLREFRVASEAEFVSAGTGQVSLAFVATEVATGKTQWVDLVVTAKNWEITEAKWRTRRFWEFWK
ncbi:hypothetical protein H5T57_03155 [Candidatus Bipolaricaulota bacterium]|nr:hypothetical protein [Candidatus Bipolaricaulota bacterium]